MRRSVRHDRGLATRRRRKRGGNAARDGCRLGQCGVARHRCNTTRSAGSNVRTECIRLCSRERAVRNSLRTTPHRAKTGASRQRRTLRGAGVLCAASRPRQTRRRFSSVRSGPVDAPRVVWRVRSAPLRLPHVTRCGACSPLRCSCCPSCGVCDAIRSGPLRCGCRASRGVDGLVQFGSVRYGCRTSRGVAHGLLRCGCRTSYGAVRSRCRSCARCAASSTDHTAHVCVSGTTPAAASADPSVVAPAAALTRTTSHHTRHEHKLRARTRHAEWDIDTDQRCLLHGAG